MSLPRIAVEGTAGAIADEDVIATSAVHGTCGVPHQSYACSVVGYTVGCDVVERSAGGCIVCDGYGTGVQDDRGQTVGVFVALISRTPSGSTSLARNAHSGMVNGAVVMFVTILSSPATGKSLLATTFTVAVAMVLLLMPSFTATSIVRGVAAAVGLGLPPLFENLTAWIAVW